MAAQKVVEESTRPKESSWEVICELHLRAPIPSVTQTKQDGVDSKTRCLLFTFVVSNGGARGEEDWSRGKHTI